MSRSYDYWLSQQHEPDLTITRVALAGNYGRRAHTLPFTDEEIQRLMQQDKEDQERWEERNKEGGKYE